MKNLKYFILFLFLGSIAFAEGPVFQHKDPITQQEFENAYQDIRTVLGLSGSDRCIDDPTFCVDVVGNDVSLADDTLVAHSDGWVLQASQPSFFVYPSVAATNATGDGTNFTILYNTERFDLNDDFNTGTYTFTSPIGGWYEFFVITQVDELSTANHAGVEMYLVTSNQTYYRQQNDIPTSLTRETYILPVLVDMDANDTVYVTFKVDGASKSVDISGGASGLYTSFSGTLIN